MEDDATKRIEKTRSLLLVVVFFSIALIVFVWAFVLLRTELILWLVAGTAMFLGILSWVARAELRKPQRHQVK
jgi:hypothetical protein